MTRSTIAVLCLAVSCMNAFPGCSDSGDSCTYECDVENATRCEGQIVQNCQRSGQGCLAWVSTKDCQSDGLFCDDSQGTALCTDECQDLCAAVGETRCRDTEVQTCQLGDAGCLLWELQKDCAIAGDVCEEGAGEAHCVLDCEDEPPALPSGPSPDNGASDVDAAEFDQVSWDAAAGATHYEVYFGSCPAPEWPLGEFTSTVETRLPGLSAEESTQYCWRVVAFSAEGCRAEGSEWAFTTLCDDPTTGPPVVTSGDQHYQPLTSGSYTLTFSEPVKDVEDNLAWIPATGSGTMASVVVVDSSTYDVFFHGAAPGDAYTLIVGTGVTDLCGYPLADPVSIQLTIDPQQGNGCEDPQDVTGAAFPHGMVGTFDWDGLGGSCAPIATNAVFFEYTPATTGFWKLDLSNATSTASSRLALFEGTGCSPYGTELTCVTSRSNLASATVELEGGTSNLLVFYTDAEEYAMVSPQITVTQVALGPGEGCVTAVDVSQETFPFSMTGTFPHVFPAGSCEPTGSNSVFYIYTPASPGSHQIDTVNNTTTSAFTRIAVYEGTTCGPYGPEVACITSPSKTGSVVVDLEAYTEYLIQVHTDGIAYTMVDPTITITAP